MALKAIAADLAEDADYRERFERESRLAASIDHPNIIPVYEAGDFDGTLYLIMRWVDGTDLRTLLKHSGRLSPSRAVRLMRPVAAALAAAHRAGLVHRDIKPANVLLARGDTEDEEHVYLTDFGIARRTSGESAMTRTGVFVGTIDYTAPERIEGGRGDAASDVYSFGCMLFETLTGHIPFARDSEVAKVFAHMNDPSLGARRGAGRTRGARRDHRQGDGQGPGRPLRVGLGAGGGARRGAPGDPDRGTGAPVATLPTAVVPAAPTAVAPPAATTVVPAARRGGVHRACASIRVHRGGGGARRSSPGSPC